MDYENGFKILEEIVKTQDNQTRGEFDSYKSQLYRNLDLEQRLGINDTIRTDVNRIIEQVNILARRLTEKSFVDLCQKQPIETENAPTPNKHPPTNQNNPYDPWNPVTPPQFVGRAKELRDLALALETSRSVSVVGDWQIGKTSILQTWAQQAQKRGHVVAMLSCKNVGKSIQTFVETISNLPASDNPDKAIDVLKRWVQQHSKPGLPPLLLVDEIGTCLRCFDLHFFNRLRGMLSTRELVLVIASRQEIDCYYKDLGLESPFGNMLELIPLGLLETDAAKTISQWGNNILDPKAMKTMLIYAGRHPFFLQLLGYYLVKAQLTGDSLDTFRQNAASHLRRLWRVLEEREQQALRDCLQGKPVKLLSLRQRGLVTEKGQLFGKILREWLEEQAI